MAFGCFSKTVGPRPSVSLGGGRVGFFVFPFGVGYIRRGLSFSCVLE